MGDIGDKLITVGVGLALLAGTWFIWFLSGVVNNFFNTKKWSWKRMLEDIAKTCVMGLAMLAWVALAEVLDWYTTQVGMDISALLDGASTTGLIGIICGGSGYYIMKAFRNFGSFIGTEHVATQVGEANYKGVSGDVKNAVKALADALTPEHLQISQQSDATATITAAEVEEILEAEGRGADISPLSRTLPDGDTDGGKGWQCSKYAGYLATGKRQYSTAHPDYGPVNGRDMVDYLINTFGWMECQKQDGAIFSYETGRWGHTGIVKDAKNNIVSDANWKPLTVSTHYINLDAVGARYCCPKSMLSGQEPDKPTPVKPVVSGQNPDKSTEAGSAVKKGDKVWVLKYVDVKGTALIPLQATPYSVYQSSPSTKTAVLKSDDGDIYARMSWDNIQKVD